MGQAVTARPRTRVSSGHGSLRPGTTHEEALPAWTAIEELVRRHHPSHDMRAYVTRPGGGKCFCVHLFQGKLDRDAASCNLQGTSFEVNPVFGKARLSVDETPWRDRGFYEYCLTEGMPERWAHSKQ